MRTPSLPSTLAARARSWAGSLSRQFVLSIVIVVVPVVLASVVIGLLMVVSGADVRVRDSDRARRRSVVAVVAARLISGGMLRDVRSIHEGLVAVSDGDRDVGSRPTRTTSWLSSPTPPTR